MSVHDDVVSRAVAARDAVRPRDAGDAFVRSLGTRDLRMRSALGSRAVLHRLELHPFQRSSYVDRFVGLVEREALRPRSSGPGSGSTRSSTGPAGTA